MAEEIAALTDADYAQLQKISFAVQSMAHYGQEQAKDDVRWLLALTQRLHDQLRGRHPFAVEHTLADLRAKLSALTGVGTLDSSEELAIVEDAVAGNADARRNCWECGCGAFSGINLAQCGRCTRNRVVSDVCSSRDGR